MNGSHIHQSPALSGRVALIVDSLVGGGAERSVLTIAGGLAERGWSVDLLTLHPPTVYEIPEGVRHSILAATDSVSDHRLAERLRDWFERRHSERLTPALILVNLVRSSRVVKQAALSVPVYHVIRNPLSAQIQKTCQLPGRFLARRLIRRLYDHENIIAISSGIIQDLRNGIGARPTQTRVIYNPFDLEEIRRMAALAESRVDELNPFVICVGHFKRQKRQDLALRAWAKAGVDGHLVFLGGGSPRKKNKLRRLALKLGTADRVHLYDWQPNVYAWIKAAKLLLLTSDFEGFGRVIVEALAVNTPVVATDCPSGPGEILTGDLVRGLAPMGDVEAIAACIRDLFKTPPVITDQHLQLFCRERIIKDYEALLMDP